MSKEIDIVFYKNLYKDLENMSDDQLLEHYYNHGINEERIVSNKDFYDRYPNFNIFLYKYLYNDLECLSKMELYYHYINNGVFENRITNIQDFYNIYPKFDLEFYKDLYNDLKIFSGNDLYIHYFKFGIHENRITNRDEYNNQLSKFNFNFYKKFNPQLQFNNNNQYFNYYIYNNNLYDFIIDNYHKPVDNTHPFYELIMDHFYYRKISKYNELVEFNSKYLNKYNLLNKEDFYKYYNDFNFEYYKNRYFKDSNLSELDILLYYHLEGKYKREIINNKYKIIIYTPPFNISSGGIVVMHYLAKIINDYNHPNFYAKLFINSNLRYKNIFCNDFAEINEINDNTIVIYPETITGNPLNCKNVVRWILLELGIEMSSDHYKSWNQNSLIYFWEPKDKINSKILRYHWINPIFTNKNLVRDKTCYLIKKGRLIHKNRKDIHPSCSICIDSLSLEEIAEIFNQSVYFYCYDPKTMYIIFAIFCGCIPVIYPIENISKTEYLEQSIFKKDGIFYDRGFSYGDSPDDIINAKNSLEEGKNDILRLLESDKITITNFLDDLLLYFDNKNSDKLIYCFDKYNY